jgi:hypothetical protein
VQRVGCQPAITDSEEIPQEPLNPPFVEIEDDEGRAREGSGTESSREWESMCKGSGEGGTAGASVAGTVREVWRGQGGSGERWVDF